MLRLDVLQINEYSHSFWWGMDSKAIEEYLKPLKLFEEELDSIY
jgi:hypothetical protein